MTSKLYNVILLVFIILMACFQSCKQDTPSMQQASSIPASMDNNNWNDYWYAGKAEVNSYNLVQSRYAQERNGTSIFVFVTEDLSKSKQVKLDNPNRNPNDKVSVMKANIIRKFNTGIYDYSLMASVFTPISADKFPHTLKVSSSSQEWCGQTWTQYNRKQGGFMIDGKSYFESEGDASIKLYADWLEDELWNRIRINPSTIPTGKIKIIPGSFFSRLEHVPFSVEQAVIEKKVSKDITTFLLTYTSINRSLKINVDNKAPYKIRSWEETTARGTTKGNLIKSMHLPYWSMNGNQFESFRDSLMLN